MGATSGRSLDFNFLLSPPSVDIANRDSESYLSSDEEEYGDLEGRGVAKWLQRVNLEGPGGYHGKSSRSTFVKDALRIRSEVLHPGSPDDTRQKLESFHKNMRPEIWSVFPVRNLLLFGKLADFIYHLRSGRFQNLPAIMAPGTILLTFRSGDYLASSSTTISST
jgi:hypothetical protein